jgi:glycosyltransferase involved in cell wall biosynthesis
MRMVMTQSNLTLRGGAERVLLKIAQHYDAKIYTAEYNLGTTFQEFRDLDVEVIGSGMLKRVLPYGRVAQGLDYGLGFYNFRIKEDYDVINAHMSPSHWIRNKNSRVLWYCHTPPRDVYDLYKFRLSLKKPREKPIYALGAEGVRLIDQSVVKRIEFILANSGNTKSRIMQYYGRSDAKVLPGGIDYGLYKRGGDRKYFVYPSRFSPNKRQDYAIRAFRAFNRVKKGYRLVLCGAVSKDKAFQGYYKSIRRLAGTVGNIEFIENANDKKLRGLLSNSTAVLYPPLNEDYGLVPLEAMASGKTVIAVNEGGPRATIKNGKTGFLASSEEEMARCMLFVADHRSIAEAIGREGMREVRAHYSWDAFFRVFDKKAREVAKG